MAGQRLSSMVAASCCCVLALLLVPAVGPRLLATRPCEEIYVVGEGETLHSISAWCGDPYILERNSHVHDPDDDFPGLVIRITKVNDERQQAASVILHRTSTMPWPVRHEVFVWIRAAEIKRLLYVLRGPAGRSFSSSPCLAGVSVYDFDL
jgi:hypothetical protein